MRRALASFFVVVVALAGCESMPGRPLEKDRPIRPKDITSFDVLWSTNCAGCHGADGQMGAARPLNDPLYLAWTSDASLRLLTQQGVNKGLMPAFAIGHGGTLTDAQIEILVQEMRHRWAKADRFTDVDLPPYVAQPGDPTRGAAAYQEFCSECHGADGTGGSVYGSIVDPSYLALVTNQALRSTVVAGRIDLGMPDYRGLVDGKSMTDEEISDVVAWLADHRTEFPGQPYPDESNKEKKDG